MEIDPQIELLVQEAIHNASAKVHDIYRRFSTKNSSLPYQRQLSERVGTFVTCLRTELSHMIGRVPPELLEHFAVLKQEMCKVNNWQDIGIFTKIAAYSHKWENHMNLTRVNEIAAKATKKGN